MDGVGAQEADGERGAKVSTFAYETLRLAEDGAHGLAALNVGVSVVLGLLAAGLGVVAGRAL